MRKTHIFVRFLPNSLSYMRLGISLGKKFGNAVQRNHFKRLIREAFRQSLWRWQCGMDVMVLPDNFNKTFDWDTLRLELDKIMENIARKN